MLSKGIVFIFVVLDIFLLGKILFAGKNVQVLNPQGLIALQEKDLIFLALMIMLVGVVPVFILAIYVARKYRADNLKASYHPDWGNHTGLQVFLWLFLISVISCLSVLVWFAAHKLDPHVVIEPKKNKLQAKAVIRAWITVMHAHIPFHITESHKEFCRYTKFFCSLMKSSW